MPIYNIVPGLMSVLGREFDKYQTFRRLANAEEEETVKAKIQNKNKIIKKYFFNLVAYE